ncbi:Na+/pantothenate symporter [Pseudarthrobacter oxydans]|uniref:Na+/pantothenate symporter n=1 Tax=Pseudarthrobacter oxydans TaxID=1671 RepID=A0AAW8NHZ4_PSEOX|nr:hypothetical protein [Pseudarthrobacter oxydans]MDR6794752.1 Na+/pantothenate symporter [Pseudarthrobacter oxydans]MDR7166189.1 Na+/pantothenate symporter [Pseudarthrobacter oxydans]
MIEEVVKVVAVLGILWMLLAVACLPTILLTWMPIVEDVKQRWAKERQQHEVNRRFKEIIREEGREVR